MIVIDIEFDDGCGVSTHDVLKELRHTLGLIVSSRARQAALT